MSADDGITALLLDFCRVLRAAGLPVGTDDAMTYCGGVATLDPSDVVDVYWAGRSALVTRKEHLVVYDREFRRYFLDVSLDDPDDPRHKLRAVASASATLDIPDAEQSGDGDDASELGLAASAMEISRTKSFADCSPKELAQLRRMIDRMRLTPPRRRTRRFQRSQAGHHLDVRRTVHAAMRSHGTVDTLHYRDRRLRVRPLVILLDVSGSMSEYSRSLLQFAYSSRRAAGKVEVFCFATRITRITRELDRRSPDQAMANAAAAVVEWDGGTRIGACLDEFVRKWGRRGLARGAIVLICSDGLDRGDPQVLDAAMQRLARQSHRIVWVSPHRGNSRVFTPTTLAMTVAAPYTDMVVGGQDLQSLEEVARVLSTLR